VNNTVLFLSRTPAVRNSLFDILNAKHITVFRLRAKVLNLPYGKTKRGGEQFPTIPLWLPSLYLIRE
jgi:hypothetical protein